MVSEKMSLKLTGDVDVTVLDGPFAPSQFTDKAIPEERVFKYPSDDLADMEYDNAYSSTYMIIIDAPVYTVQRHLKQVGYNKAGSYSSESLERVFARLSLLNQYEVREEYQQPNLLVADGAGPFDFHGMIMGRADVVPDKYLVYWVDVKYPPAALGSYAFRFPGIEHSAMAWCSYAAPLKGGQTHLINHWRLGYEPDMTSQKVLNWINIGMIGSCMTSLQNLYVKRVLEFYKKQYLAGRLMRGALGGRFFNADTPTGRWDGTSSFEETHTW